MHSNKRLIRMIAELTGLSDETAIDKCGNLRRIQFDYKLRNLPKTEVTASILGEGFLPEVVKPKLVYPKYTMRTKPVSARHKHIADAKAFKPLEFEPVSEIWKRFGIN